MTELISEREETASRGYSCCDVGTLSEDEI